MDAIAAVEAGSESTRRSGFLTLTHIWASLINSRFHHKPIIGASFGAFLLNGCGKRRECCGFARCAIDSRFTVSHREGGFVRLRQKSSYRLVKPATLRTLKVLATGRLPLLDATSDVWGSCGRLIFKRTRLKSMVSVARLSIGSAPIVERETMNGVH